MLATKNVTTVFYKTDSCAIICSVEILQKTATTPSLQIISPYKFIDDSLFRLSFKSTAHHIVVHPVIGGSMIECINSIAFCLLKAGVPCDILVGAITGSSFMLLCPKKNAIEYLYIEGNQPSIVQDLNRMCLETYNRIYTENSNKIV